MKKNPLSKIASQLGKIGGKKSVESRFKNKTKQEISEIMRKVRYTAEDKKKIQQHGSDFVDGLNKGMNK